MASKFTIGQRVRVVRVGAWNGTWPIPWVIDALVHYGTEGTVSRTQQPDSISVRMDAPELGVLQFLPDELAVLDNTSGDSVE